MNEVSKLNLNGSTYDIKDTQARNGVNNLDSKINSINESLKNLSNGSPIGVYNTTESLTNANPKDGVYLISGTGHIYSWTKSTSNLVDLGVYQSSVINDSVISFNNMDEILKGFFSYNFKNVENIEWKENNFYNCESMTLTSYAQTDCTEITVNPGEVYYLKGRSESSARLYNLVNKDGSLHSTCELGNNLEKIIVIPENVNKIQVNYWTNYGFTFKKSNKFTTSQIDINDSSVLMSKLENKLKDVFDYHFVNQDVIYTDNNFWDYFYKKGMPHNSLRYAELSVNEGDVFHIKGYSSSNAKLYNLINIDNELYSMADDGELDEIVIIPKNVNKIIINHWKDYSITIEKCDKYIVKENDFIYELSPFVMKNKTIICAGDSLTDHNYHTSSSFVTTFDDYFPGCEVLNYGSGGAYPKRMVNYLTNMVRDTMVDENNDIMFPALNPDYSNCTGVLINIGTNGGVDGTLTGSIPQLSKATDLEGNPLKNIDVTKAINGGFNYNGVLIDTEEKYFNLFANDWYGNVALCIEYIQYKNPKTQIFLHPPLIAYNLPVNNKNGAKTIANAMLELVDLYGVNYIDTLHGLNINTRNSDHFSYDGVHGTAERDKMLGSYLAKQIFNKIY